MTTPQHIALHKIVFGSFINCYIVFSKLADTFKRRLVFHWIRKFHKGICFLQETHSTSETEQIWASEWGTKIHFHMAQAIAEEFLY